MRKIKKINFLYAAFVAELLLIFYLRNDTGFILSPLLILSAGLFLAVYPFFIIRSEHNIQIEKKSVVLNKLKNGKNIWLIFSGLSLIFIFWSYIIFQKNPVAINQSDIIPFIRDVMVKRFLSGETVYAPVIFNGYPTAFTPNYLPFQWGPFLVTAVLNIDLRWTYVIMFLGATAFYVYHLTKKEEPVSKWLLNVFLPFIVVFSIYLKQARDAAHTIEILIMSYYLFLASSLFVKSNLIRALALTFPVLSRFSFLFWLPVYFYSGLRAHWKKYLSLGLIFTGFILLFFIVPFVIPNPSFLKTFNDIYLDGAIGEWSGQSWQQPGDRPFQLFQGMGFASWFYYFFEGSLIEKILALKMTLMGACIISMFLPVLFFNKARKVISHQLFSLLALKFCLTLFYAFILVPYIYLFWVPLMVSVVIISRMNERTES
ncbi:MAG: hypothetical protein Q8M15_15255 [Bacteroidota bacterium]|nr:hypothetical protein [Bacteroidota bacterium]